MADNVQRKLTVIFSADVVGYSGLMERDESGTHRRLLENRKELFDPIVISHGGRIVKLIGDGALIEFSSTVAAVTCAIEIQQATDARENNRPESERLRYRIGINLGEIILQGDDIYGDGVNVAARIQALAPPGGIAVSHSVTEQVRGRLDAAFEDLGMHAVKNIDRPIHVYFVRKEGLRATPAVAAQKPERRVAVCVLPFANMSGEPEQEYFSDGISEDIITDLSKVSALFVIARNTAFTFKGKAVDVPQIARALNATHVLEGSVRKSGNRVRITAQLVDGASGGHVWAERYDRDLSDIFSLQDEISHAIVAALKVKLLPAEREAIERRGTTNAKAYEIFLMARQHSVTGNQGSRHRNETISRLCRRAIEIDPNYARAWAMLASAQASSRHLGGHDDNGLAAAERALRLDPSLAEAHAVKSRVLLQNAKYDAARVAVEEALRLDPESYEANKAAGELHYHTHKPVDAIRFFEKASALMDTDYSCAGMTVSSYMALGDRDGARRMGQQAFARAERVVTFEPDNGGAISFAVLGLAAMGDGNRAKEWIERALIVDPDNFLMRYNFACTLLLYLNDKEAALDILTSAPEALTSEKLNWFRTDPDLDSIRDHPRFKAMLATAETKLKLDVAPPRG